MLLRTLAKRAIALKSNRSEDPQVKLNIRLTHCESLAEIMSIIKDQEMDRSQKTFALRILTRNVNARSDDLPYLECKEYSQLTKHAEESVKELKALEVSDVVYWIKTMRIYNVPNLSIEGFISLQERVNELCGTNSFTIRQAGTLVNDISQCGHTNTCLLDFLLHKFPKETSLVTLSDLKNILSAIKISNHYLNDELIQKCLKHVLVLATNRTNLQETLKVIRILCYISPYSNEAAINIKRLIDIVIKFSDFFSQIDIFYMIKINKQFPGIFPQEFLDKLFQKLLKAFKNNFNAISNDILGNLLGYFSEDNPAHLELLAVVNEKIKEKAINKGYSLYALAKFASYCDNLKSTSEMLQTFFHSQMILGFVDKGLFEPLMLKSRFSNEDFMEKHKISDEFILKRLINKPIHTWTNRLESLDPSINKLHAAFYKNLQQKLEEFVCVDYLNSKLLYSLTEKAVIRDNECYSGVKKSIVKMLVNSKFDIDNFMIISALAEENELKSYTKTIKHPMSKTLLESSLRKNIERIPPHSWKILVDHFHLDSPV